MYLVGSLALVSVSGCGRFGAEREAWRREAEIACLKSGAVREGAGIIRVDAISGPGACGADYPLKVASLGETTSLGFADDMRPPGAIPGSTARSAALPRWPTSPASSRDDRAVSHDQPVSLRAPGVSETITDDVVVESETVREVISSSASSQTRIAPLPAPSGSVNTAPLPRFGPASSALPSPVTITPAATLACPLVATLERWMVRDVQPAAMRWFGVQVVSVKQISAYSCRGMNGNRSSRISEHAFGNALDIAAFNLADGRIISVKSGWRGLPEEQGFLRDVQGAACQYFSTVLAPGSNIYHYDHIHVDLMRRASERVVCRPEAVSGEEVAARVSGGRYAARDRETTGSITQLLRRRNITTSADEEGADDR